MNALIRPAEHPAPAPICLFLGPTLPLAEARRLLPAASIFPPARLGDVYALIGRGVHSIGLIDGVFHGVSSIWQRELLTAIDAGIRVLGASSMGALRAAELHQFGMEGVGQVFAWYRDGVIEADDAVALLHAPEPPYTGFSEPLVNLRDALETAAGAGTLSDDAVVRALAWLAKQYYPDRHYTALIQQAPALGFSAAEIAVLRTLAAASPSDAIKARDARALIALLAGPEPPASAATRWPPPALSPFGANGYRPLGWLQRRVVIDGGGPRAYSDLTPLLETPSAAQVVAAVRRRCYALHQLDTLALPAPAEDFLARYRAAHAAHHGWQANDAERAALALTAADWQAQVDALAALEWWILAHLDAHPRCDQTLLSRLAAVLAADGQQPDPLVSAVPGVMLRGTPAERLARIRAAEYCLMADWCESAGLEPPAAVSAAASAADATTAALQQARALTDWLAAISPAQLGFGITWNDGAEALRHLAVSNALRRLLPEQTGDQRGDRPAPRTADDQELPR